MKEKRERERRGAFFCFLASEIEREEGEFFMTLIRGEGKGALILYQVCRCLVYIPMWCSSSRRRADDDKASFLLWADSPISKQYYEKVENGIFLGHTRLPSTHLVLCAVCVCVCSPPLPPFFPNLQLLISLIKGMTP